MATVRSKWAITSPIISGSFSPGEWTNAGQLPIQAGYLLAKNDNRYLYLAMDLVSDAGNSPGVGDYFWLSFDVDGNRSITPGTDVNYSIYPTLPIRIGRQYYLGAGTWTTLLPGPSNSLARQGFGASPSAATPHRIWELRIELAEIGVSLTGTTTLPVIGFGLRVASSSPAFVYNYPANFFNDFSNLHQIALSLGPDTDLPGGGSVIGTVGVIPTGASIIMGGRATTASSYTPFVQNAAFGGTMHLRGNHETMQNLWLNDARKYRVLHRHGSAGAFTPILQSWSNYRWDGTDYVLESFGPDPDNKYVMLNPTLEYSIHNLLLQWASNGFLPGIHEFRVEFFNAGGHPVTAPAQTLQLYLDNNLPDAQILGVRYHGVDILPCAIVDVDETAVPVQVHIRAFDSEGNLFSYVLNAHYGNNQVFSPPLANVPYPGGNWQGDADRWVSAPVTPKFPPITCAYQLRLSAYPRVTNGYGYIGYNEATYHVTFRRPGAPTMARPVTEFPLGFSGPDNRFKPGTTPKKLGG